MLTVSQLAHSCNISRTTVLYYERAGLLLPACRGENGYRWYGDKEVNRLKNIISYRSFGLSIKEIAPLLEQQNDINKYKKQQVLLNQFNALEQEVAKLRQQQRAIVMLLEQPTLLTHNQLTKTRWVDIMKSAGFDQAAMHNWHKQFEKMEPNGHQQFLESLHIDPQEIDIIRRGSKN